MPNRLSGETSPYLLQHQDNPVEWYPWGEEAFERAKQENKPVFLSIGYSACHWCHVMAHESFEDKATAALLNEHYISVKVDREERPDVDAIYMNAVQALTGRGGWPMSVWLLPDGRPFYGGTYFPPEPRHGMPSFKQVLLRIAQIYQEKRDSLENDASRLTDAISGRIMLDQGEGEALSQDVLHAAFQHLANRFDTRHGGFSTQPKFPPSMTLELLLRLHHRFGWQHALDMVTHTLDRMAWGGMYDQLGGGFHRYSVDALWLVPHFEKMLYDNALLLRTYLYGYQVTGQPRYRRVVEETAAYLRREMTEPSGGFASSQDADSEGEEGKYYTWQEDELRAVLRQHVNVEAVLDYWGVLRGPNFEGANILWVPESPEVVALRHSLAVPTLLDEVKRAREILLAVREQRIKPRRDGKVLTAWNGLMISSLAQAGRALGRADYVEMAARAAAFMLSSLRSEGRLRRSYKDGQARYNGYLEDYALLSEGLLELYQTTFDLHWLQETVRLAEQMIDLFWDDEAGFYDTAHDHEGLITRPQELTDNATPSGTSAAVEVLLRLAILADRPDWRDRAERVLARLAPAIQQYATAFSFLASQLDFALGAPHEVALVGDPAGEDMQALLAELRQPYRPNHIAALWPPGDDAAPATIPLLAGREQVEGKATAYVCRDFICRLPVTSPEALRAELATAPPA